MESRLQSKWRFILNRRVLRSCSLTRPWGLLLRQHSLLPGVKAGGPLDRGVLAARVVVDAVPAFSVVVPARQALDSVDLVLLAAIGVTRDHAGAPATGSAVYAHVLVPPLPRVATGNARGKPAILLFLPVLYGRTAMRLTTPHPLEDGLTSMWTQSPWRTNSSHGSASA